MVTILGIETSCDETAISIIEGREDALAVLGDKTLSQIELHKKYGGVFPNVAKREHSRTLVPLLLTVLDEAARSDFRFKIKDVSKNESSDFLESYNLQLKSLLEREPELLQDFLRFIPTIEKPSIDAIAVTEGPGLEPCLWTGINFAKALSLHWNVPVIPVNHMEGHIISAVLRRNDEFSSINSQFSKQKTTNYKLQTINFPALALLISGGHTELVLIKEQFDYKIIGQTRDDAVGEAFDKVARLLGLPYPGGPEISRLAEAARQSKQGPTLKSEKRSDLVLPRPMLHSKDFNFSFSGLKTAVLYLLKKIPELTEDVKKMIALEFENAVTDVLVTKTNAAAEQYGVKALLIGGGVIANAHIRRNFEALEQELGIPVLIPATRLTTDNALMIAVAGYLKPRFQKADSADGIRARGNRRLDEQMESV